MSWRTELKKLSPELIRLATKLKESDIKQSVGGQDDSDLKSTNSCDFKKIQKMEIPEKFTYEFWRYMNMFADYWGYRYDFELPEKSILKKSIIRDTIAYGSMYGLTGIDKATGIGYSLTIRDGKWVGTALSSIDKDYFVQGTDGHWNANLDGSKYIIKEFKREELAILKWRRNGIGNFVWYMIPTLEFIQADKIAKVNLSMLKNMLWYEVYDKDNANNEIAKILDTFEPVITITGSKKIPKNSIGSFNGITQDAFAKDPRIEKIIEMCKYEWEFLMYQMGIPQTSAKNQSLSSDVSLSVSTAGIYAKQYDENVKEFLKELGIEQVEIPEAEISVDNQNADKQGKGIANTEGQIAKDKAKGGE